MKRVLVTGATGFIGQHTLPLLADKGYEVHAVSSEAVREAEPDLRWHQANLLDAAQVARLMAEIAPTHLLHFAWFTTPGAYWTSLMNLRWVQASLELLQAFVQHGGRRVVMAGTCAEYEWRDGNCSELTTPLLPATLYGTCKHSLHLILESVVKQTGLSAAWGRLFFLYGPREHPARLVSSVINSLLRDETARCTHGEHLRDFLYVQDVADAFVALMESEVTGAVNIGSGQPVAVKEVIHQIADKLNKKHLIELGALPTPAGEPGYLIAETRRLSDEVGWSPRFNLEQGIEKTIQWWENLASRH